MDNAIVSALKESIIRNVHENGRAFVHPAYTIPFRIWLLAAGNQYKATKLADDWIMVEKKDG